MKRHTPVLIALALLTALVAGVALRGPVASHLAAREAERVIARYNVALADYLAVGEAGALREVTGEEEFASIANYLGIYEAKGTRLDSVLLEMTVTSVERAGAEIVVETVERWSYREVDLRTGDNVQEARIQRIEMRYTLAREEESGALMVADSHALGEPAVEAEERP